MTSIYVASSWRNPFQLAVVRLLRDHGHEVYDYRQPMPGDHGFHWSHVNDKPRPEWSALDHRAALANPIACRGFELDMGALRRCEVCLLVLPCGRSAHLELGWAAGAGKRTAVVFPEGLTMVEVGPVEPELMLKVADEILVDADELWRWSFRLAEPRGLGR